MLKYIPALLLLLPCSLLGHQKDRECFPGQLQAGHLQTVQAREVAILDIKHVYSSGGIDTTKKEERVILKKGENKTIALYARGYSKFNPRELWLQNEDGIVKVAMGEMVYFYNSVLVESSIDWTCWSSSLSPGGLASDIFSTHQEYRHGQFTFLRDRVEVARVGDDEIVGEEQDRQCWDMMAPEETRVFSRSHRTANLSLTHLSTTSSTTGSWTLVKANQTVSLEEGVKQVLEFEYKPNEEERFGDYNPRNLTVLLRDSTVYLAMARQQAGQFYNSYNHQWTYSDSWTCNETSFVIPVTSNETLQLPFYQFSQYGTTLFTFRETLEVSVNSGPSLASYHVSTIMLIAKALSVIMFYS